MFKLNFESVCLVIDVLPHHQKPEDNQLNTEQPKVAQGGVFFN